MSIAMRRSTGWSVAGVFLACIAALLAPGGRAAQGQPPMRTLPLTAAPDRVDGVYKVGDTVHWTVTWSGDADVPPIHYTLKSGGLKGVAQGDLSFSKHVATLDSKFDAPGTLLLDVQWQAGGPPRHLLAGAVAAPERILPSAPPPSDFDAFWKSQLKDLKKVPFNPQLEPAEGGKPGVSYWKITLDNIHDTHIHGQLARPEQGEKFPAMLIVQWAGVYPLQKGWATDRAAEGWLALDIEAHDIPIDSPNAFYQEQSAGPLKNYWSIGNDDRNASYFLRMYLSCYQALEYLKSRPDWNGKTLVVMGTSQGGQQTLMLAGLHPQDLTAAMALVPAGCDMLAPEAGRAPAFPQWYYHTEDGKDPKKVHETSRYFDVVNFARHIKCPVLVGLGLRDDVCPPTSVLSAVNVIPGKKEVVILPKSGHQNENGSQDPFNVRCYGPWLTALREGKPAPVEQEAAGASTRADKKPASKLLPLKVVGLQVQNSKKERVHLQGVNAACMEWTSDGEGHILDTVKTAIQDWHVNIIRLPLSQDRWFGKAPEQKDEGVAYRALVKQIVDTCAAMNCYIMLDLHWSDAGVWGQQIGQHVMPDAHSVEFWKECAAAYKNHPAVLFDLYNEPHDVTWDIWLNGGEVTERDRQRNFTNTYTAVGMQALLDTVRATGAKNLIVAGGLDWAYDLSGFLNGKQLTDKTGNGVLYANHNYPIKGDTFEKWLSKMEAATKQIPVIVSEFGSGGPPRRNQQGQGDQWIRQVLQAIHDHQWDWVAWDMHPRAGPTLISDWDHYTPTPNFGVYVKEELEGKLPPYTPPSSTTTPATSPSAAPSPAPPMR
ncbi:MAG TPA: acetylxylan esterase [Chthonomonadaceae bacterium]|nr:acetylxylan esterase [Chthonomonadaceae bacterium]